MTSRDPLNLALGAELRAAREAAGFTRNQVCAHTLRRFCYRDLNAWEIGEHAPRLANLFDLCEVYGVPPGFVVARAERRLQLAQETATEPQEVAS